MENDASPDHPKEGTNPSGGKKTTVPSLCALAILQKATDIDNIFSLGVDEIYRRLYSGFLLLDKEKKLDKNCVLVLSKTMDITWSADKQYGEYIDEKVQCFEGEMYIPVAKLIGVTWLDVLGKFETIVLSPKTTYEAAFVVKMSSSSSGWHTLSVNLSPPDGNVQERIENLRNKPKEKWFQIPIGSFVTSPMNVGELSFQLKEIEGPKTGLLIKGVLLQPKD